ncbi:hypothetical protein GCM10010232_18190 [Streptomyces amakusaensis]
MDNPLRYPPCECSDPDCPERTPSEQAEPRVESPVLAALRARVREDNGRRASGRGAR